MAEVWDTWEIEPLEFLENGERVFVEHRVRARGKGSGIEVVQTYWSVWTVRDGKGVRLALYVDRDASPGRRRNRLAAHPPERAVKLASRSTESCLPRAWPSVTFRALRTNVCSIC